MYMYYTIFNNYDLYVFYMVAKEMSFTKASNKLNISQSGVSHTIRALEKRLKVALFQRTTRSIALTEAGLSLYKNLSLSFEQINSSLQLLDDFREKKNRLLGIMRSDTQCSRSILQ